MSGTAMGTRPTKRWASAAVVIASTVAVLASPLAIGSASAAAGTVTITEGAHSNQPVGGTATVKATTTSASAVYALVNFGPDAAAGLTGTPCAGPVTGVWTCTITSGGVAGDDNVIVYADDNGGTHAFGAGDPSAQTTVTFSGPPISLGVASTRNPVSQSITTDTSTCEVYKVSAFDSAPRPAGHRVITVVASEAAGANPFTVDAIDVNGLCTTTGAPTETEGGGGANPQTSTFSVTTGDDGTATFGLTSSTPGTGTVKASFGAPASAQSGPVSVTWVQGGQDAVAHLSVTPSGSTGYTGTTATYTVTATDSTGNPVQGALLSAQTTNGPGTAAPTGCGSTNQNGVTTCAITNSGTPGTDNETFWVDYTPARVCADGSADNHLDSCEPSVTVAAQFNAIPPFNTHTLTCVQQLSGAQQGQGVGSCAVPTSQHSIDFSETLKENGTPVAGVIVTFNGTAKLGGVSGKTISGTATTDANGIATFTVADPSAQDGDTATVATNVGAPVLDSASGFWQDPEASSFTLSPGVQSVSKGGVVTLHAKIVDQFGNGVSSSNSLGYTVTGRNSGWVGVVTTDQTGVATISYTDAGLQASQSADSIVVTDQTPPLNGQSQNASVIYINGSTAASTVTVDSSGSGTSDGTCAIAGHNAATNVALGGTTEVCAVVKNNFSTPEALAGKTVTFTVNNGAVASHGGLSSSSTASYVATTDANGVAFADVTSTHSGAQTVTAAADSATGTGTVTYATPTIGSARNVKVSPASGPVTAGSQQKFTFTVTDQYGNGVPGVSVLVTQSGSGILSGGNTTVPTASDGTASVLLTTQATDTGGIGSVTGSISGGNQCGLAAGNPAGATAGNCTAVAAYTVAAPVVPSSLVVVAAPGARVGTEELVAATVKNSDGSPAVNQVVRFKITGANSASGAVVTNAKGVALFGFLPKHAGSTHIAAYDDVNANVVQEASEPHGSLNMAVAKVTEKPTIKLTSASGTVTIHVTSHPKLANAKVTYYVKHHGNFTKIGSGKTGHAGKASQTFVEGKGVRYTFRAKVTGKSGVATGVSKSKSIKVKK